MFKSQIVTFAGVFLLIGIFAASSGWSFYGTSFLILIFLFAFFWYKKREKFYKGIALIFIFFALGFFYYHFFTNFFEVRTKVIFNQEIEFVGKVVSDPRFFENTQVFDLKLQESDQGTVVVLLPLSPKFEYGDQVKFNGKIERGVDRRTKPTVFFPDANLLQKHQGFWVKEKLLRFKAVQLAQFRRFLSRDQAALLAGETFGFRGDFTEELKSAMNLSGTTHIVALSGYNIAILVLAIQKTLTNFMSRKKRFWLIILVILLFLIMVGGEASVVRAALMGFLVLLAREAGRPYDVFRAIILAAVLMAILNPNILHYDVGFQLSFLSLLGLVYLEPVVSKFFKVQDKPPSFLSWRENGIIALSAQLAVAPIIIQNFNQFSLTSIFSNILILEVVPLAMFFGFLIGTLASIWSVLGFLAAKFTAVILAYQIWVIKFFAGIPWFIGGQFFPKFFLIGYYLILASSVFFYYYGKKKGTGFG